MKKDLEESNGWITKKSILDKKNRPTMEFVQTLDEIPPMSYDLIDFTKYKNLSIPVTILAGIGDRVTPNKTHSFQLHKNIKHSKLIELSNVEHSIPELNPMKIIEEIQ